MIEEWRPVSGFEEFYAVSNFGRVKSLSRTILDKRGWPRKLRGRIMSGRVTGRVQISLRKPGEKQIKRLAHRLVAAAFNPAEGKEITHIDGNKLNNAFENLEWRSHTEIMTRAWANGAFAQQSGAAEGRKEERCNKLLSETPPTNPWIRTWSRSWARCSC
jgi:hypothetical protein